VNVDFNHKSCAERYMTSWETLYPPVTYVRYLWEWFITV